MMSLTQFLKSKLSKAKKEEGKITHTRIPCKTNNIYGGSYICNGEDEHELYDLIYKEVVLGGKMEYLTEKQLKDNVIYIDLDFHYSHDITARQYDTDWVGELICIYLETIQKLMIVDTDITIPVYVLQKDGVNRLADGSKTKDGVHIIISIKMANKLQLKLREMVMNHDETKELLKMLPLINNADAVFDEGLSKGTTNAQVYGCRKPAHEPYKLTKIYDCTFNNCWSLNDRPFSEITKELFLELSVRHGNRLEFEMTEFSKQAINPIATLRQAREQQYDADFTNKNDVETLVMECISGVRCATGNYNEAYNVRQAIKNAIGENGRDLYRRYTEKAYLENKGSFNKHNEWETDWDNVPTGGALTVASLHYYAKQDNPIKYAELFKKQNECIKRKDAEALFETIIHSSTDVAFARYFTALYGNNFKCIDIYKRMFYTFTKECLWIQDIGGTPIRNIISNELKTRFITKLQEIGEEIILLDKENEDDKIALENSERIQKKIAECLIKMEKTNEKNNILREIMDMVKDAEFEKTMNKEQYVLPLKHGKILDMKTLEVRERTIANKFNYECDTSYRELTEAENTEMEKYFNDLFCGKKDTVQVVLNILKSVMTGVTLRYIYFITGTGRNGKSVLFNILSAIFKKGMDVISKDVVLQKKSNSHLNTEVEKLDRCRLGYTTELKEEDKTNETMIKAITGGDKINVRGIQKTDDTLIPTTNLFVLTNQLPKLDVEPAICDRLIVIPFLNTFEVDKDFERNMIDKRELVFCYIMKHGNICDKFELTQEMKVAKEEYIEANVTNYLKDFIDSECEPANGKKIERDEFRIRYNEYCRLRNYKIDKTTNTTFTKNMKLNSIESKKSNGKTHYTDIQWRVYKPSENELDEKEV